MIKWFFNRMDFKRKLRKICRDNSISIVPQKTKYFLRTLKSPDYDFIIIKNNVEYNVKLADLPDKFIKHISYRFVGCDTVTVCINEIPAFANAYTEKAIDISKLNQKQSGRLIVFLGKEKSFYYKDTGKTTVSYQNFVPYQSVFGYDIHNKNTFLEFLKK